RNMVDQAWSGINVHLKRRHDLVPNLVSSVSAYVSHERGIMSEVTRAHEGAREGGGGPAAVAPAERALGAALGRLIGLSEAYPQLRASEHFLALQAQLADT